DRKSRSYHTQETDDDRSIVVMTLAVIMRWRAVIMRWRAVIMRWGAVIMRSGALIMRSGAPIRRWGALIMRRRAIVLALLLMLATMAVELPQYPPYYTMVTQHSHDAYATLEMRVANDVRNAIA